MKKLFLISAIAAPVAGLGITAAVVAPLIAAGANPDRYVFSVSKYEANRNFKADEYKLDAAPKNPIAYNDEADINLYYNGDGTVTFSYLQKLALLALGNGKTHDKEIHFAYAPDNFDYQGKMNVELFESLLKIFNKKSQMINVHDDYRGSIIDEWKRIIEENPNKKINVWWNSNHVWGRNGSEDVKLLDLAGYKNVNIQLIEDGAAIGYVTNYLDDANLNSQFTTYKDAVNMDIRTQYFAPKLFDNVYSWFSSAAMAKYATQPGFERFLTFDAKSLADEVFNTKITLTEEQANKFNAIIGSKTFAAGEIRLFKLWPFVTGLNWKDALETVQKAAADRPGAKSLILLGSYQDPTEEDYIRHVWETYHKDYNIFYKGHPGHTEHTRWILDTFIPQEAHEGMYALEPAIASEELTRDHIADGLKFDAVVCVGGTSAMGGFPKDEYDLSKIFLERHDYDKNTNTGITYVNGTPEWQGIEDWLKTSGWM